MRPLELVVRPMQPEELVMVLSDWKREIVDMRRYHAWSTGVLRPDLWNLVNYVLDHITVPSSKIMMGCHPKSLEVPMCWAAVRDDKVLTTYVRRRVREDVELGYSLERSFLDLLAPAERLGEPFNPFKELNR